jgi:transcriptional regulator with XRE-family HTH domain
MPTDYRGITPLDWRALIDEALRRRKAEKLTQRDHAALASVSIPTIVSFDRGEETLTLAKAFDILRVVGLLDEHDRKEGAQGMFVQDAFTRWRELTKNLAANSPGRFPDGWYRIDYALKGDLIDYELHEFEELLRKSIVRHTGWPLFLFLNRPELRPYEKDGVIECWLKPADAGLERVDANAAHCDFWRAAPTGRAFIIRGYQEDTQDTFQPRTIFDTTLPAWRLGEAVLHAKNLADQLAADQQKVVIHLRALYTGLSGRVLRAWANPFADLMVEGGAARSDEAFLEVTIPAKDVETNLAHHLQPLLASLYERFGVTGLTVDRVAAELDKMRKNRFGAGS